jgi:PLP dependent protein
MLYIELKGEDIVVNHITLNIRTIEERIVNAAKSCGRLADEVTLLAISKTFSKECILQAIESGLWQFGENRVQEAEGKIIILNSSRKIEWHLIGHLQSNKARRAAELFDMIHTIDSIKIAVKIDQACKEIGKIMPVLVEVNLGAEDSKSGVDSTQVRDLVETVNKLENLHIDGLMTIPPYFNNPEEVRPYFSKLRELGESLESEQRGCLGRRHLSMGMSHDFEAAIQEGATIVRIGTAIFGSRNYDE